jgi:hypothetical protein
MRAGNQAIPTPSLTALCADKQMTWALIVESVREIEASDGIVCALPERPRERERERKSRRRVPCGHTIIGRSLRSRLSEKRLMGPSVSPLLSVAFPLQNRQPERTGIIV